MSVTHAASAVQGRIGLASLVLVSLVAPGARAEPLKEPPVFQSHDGLLDILMVARPNTKPLFGLSGPVGWIYEICQNPGSGAQSCPAGPHRSDAYGGTRLALRPGDKLKVRLVNALPAFADGQSKHALEPGHGDLALNPTNIHTHGLIVEPRRPTKSRPTWGDNIYVLTYNPANGMPQTNLPATSPMHHASAITNQPIDYEIDIPANHPSGSYWFHPHSHGIALNQVSAGLGGIITIGDAADYACEDWACAARWQDGNVRNLVLKDIQVLNAVGIPSALTQEDPSFCAPDALPGEPARLGFCSGQPADPSDPNSADYTNGRWYFSVNGQAYPSIPISSPKGEIWRLTNESGSNSYDLHLYNDDAATDMVMQVVSVDGVSISADAVISNQQMAQIGGSKLRLTDCQLSAPVPSGVAPPVCVTSLRMYPSSRVEVWVAYRDATGKLASPPKNARATFKTVGLNTGVAGDSWPSVSLADVQFRYGARAAGSPEFANLHGHVKTSLAAGGVFTTAAPVTIQADPVLPAGTKCEALPAGHKRRIYYGLPSANPEGFGLAYEEIDQFGNVVGPPATDVVQFDPSTPVVCLPLAKGNAPVKETWELVNLAGEDHNFHIHQTKFRVVGAPTKLSRRATLVSHTIPQLPFPAGSVLHDNIPLPSATETPATQDGSGCGGFAEYNQGSCSPTKLTVEIAFSQIGEFVYHCHILEHEDGGMMAKIVVKNSGH
jgi:L-ascorbate oxidase